jgi:uncharacterized protein with FMN-binding domain
MRRAPIVLAATAAGLAGVLSFQSHKPRSSIAVGTSGSSGGTKTTTPAVPATPATGPANPGVGATSPTSAPATTAPSSGTRSATGAVEQYPYGQLSVTVTETGGHVTDIQMASLSETDSRSVMIDDDAIPQLRGQVLSAQSANINGVSGATFTSQAYAQSVQSALDQLGVR